MKKLLIEILRYLFFNTPWGKVVILKSWFEYKNSLLYEERAKEFGHIPATKMYQWSEMQFFMKKVLEDKKYMWSILYPYTELNRMAELDTFYRPYIKFKINEKKA